MAIEPALKEFDSEMREAIRRIRDTLDHYAQSQNWKSEEYYIFIVINAKWRKISVGLISSHFHRDQLERFTKLNEVWDFLKEEFEAEPDLYNSIGLFIWPIEGYSLNRSYGEDMIEVDDEYLNPGKPPLRVAPITTNS